jgi:hypothetical protein
MSGSECVHGKLESATGHPAHNHTSHSYSYSHLYVKVKQSQQKAPASKIAPCTIPTCRNDLDVLTR